jgi:hypothetical protein
LFLDGQNAPFGTGCTASNRSRRSTTSSERTEHSANSLIPRQKSIGKIVKPALTRFGTLVAMYGGAGMETRPDDLIGLVERPEHSLPVH